MPTAYSAERTNSVAIANGTGYSRNSALNTSHSALKVNVGTYMSTAIASGSTIEMLRIPKNARIIRGYLATGALGTSVTLGLGNDVSFVKEDGSTVLTTASATSCLAQTAHAVATVTPVCATRLLGAGGLTTALTTFTLTTAGATLTADIEVVLVIEYIQH